MMTMACIKRKISVASLIRTLVIVYFGNMVGAIALAYLVYLSGQYNYTRVNGTRITILIRCLWNVI